jgi:hypothetical protein
MVRWLWFGSISGFSFGFGLAVLLNPPPSGILQFDLLESELLNLLLAFWLLLSFPGFVIGGMLGFITRRRD